MVLAPAIRRMTALVAVTAAAACALAVLPQQASANGCLFPPVWDPDTNTYTITTPEQLRTLHQGACDMSATIRLANDIDLTGTGDFLPIGSPSDPFTGTFDGAGHAITGLLVTTGATDGIGLIGTSDDGATIRDLRVTGTLTATGGGVGDNQAGMVVGNATGTTITNVQVRGTVNAGGAVGGVVGYMLRGAVRDSTTSAVITGFSGVGGIAGTVETDTGAPAEISGARTEGSVTSTDGQAGGIVGLVMGGSITRSSTAAIVVGQRAGGILGQAQSPSGVPVTVSDSYASGPVRAYSASAQAIGGIVGAQCAALDGANLLRNYFTGPLEVAGNAASGGILGGITSCVVSVGAQATVTGNLWNTDTAGPAAARGTVGVGRTTAQMKQIGTYTELGWSIANGWDANPTTTWLICAQVNDGYPFQRGQVSATPCREPAAAPSASPTAAALTATLLPSRRRVLSGQRMRIGIRTANAGGTAAQAVTSCIRLPSNMVITSTGGATRSGRTACFRVGTVAAGAKATKVLTVRAVSTRRLTVTVTGSARSTGVAKVQAAAKRVTVTPRAARARVTG